MGERDCHIHVGIVKDNHWRFTAQLERDGLQINSITFNQHTAYRSVSGEGNLVHVGMARQVISSNWTKA